MKALSPLLIALAGCASPAPNQRVDTSETAKWFTDACMGEWVSVSPAVSRASGPFRLNILPGGRFEASIGNEVFVGQWQSVGTLDAAVLMTDAKSGKVLEIYECPLNDPTVTIDDDPFEYHVRRPS